MSNALSSSAQRVILTDARQTVSNTPASIINIASCKQTFYEIEMIPFIKSIIEPFALFPVMNASQNATVISTQLYSPPGILNIYAPKMEISQ